MAQQPSVGNANSGLSSKNPDSLFAWIQLTNRCNLSCVYCYTESGPDPSGAELPFEIAKQSLIDVKRAGAINVMLSGGEPAIYPRLIELIEYACEELELKITLVSNGTYLKPELVEALKKYQCVVQISLDAVDQQGYAAIRGKDILPKALAGIDTLLENEIEITLSSTLTTINQQYAKQIVEYAVDRGIQFVHFAPTHWKEGGPFRPNLFIHDLYSVLRDLYALQKKHYLYLSIDLIENLVVPVALGIKRKFYCNAMAGRTVEVASDGGVYFCAAQRDVDEMKMGSISNDRTLYQIIDEAKAKKSFPILGADTIEECLSCEYRYVCAGGCRAMTWHQAGGLNRKHPNCDDLKRFITDIKNDIQTGEISDYVDFLASTVPINDNPDGLLKYF